MIIILSELCLGGDGTYYLHIGEALQISLNMLFPISSVRGNLLSALRALLQRDLTCRLSNAYWAHLSYAEVLVRLSSSLDIFMAFISSRHLLSL